MAEKKLKMSDDDLIEYIQECYGEADEHFTGIIKPIQDECWNLYRIWRDYSKKEDWQAKHVNPRAFASVEIGVALVKKALIYTRDFFNVKGQERKDKEKESIVKEAINFYIRRAKFFVKFLESLKMAFIGGLGCIKIYWRRWEEDIVGMETTYETIPFKIFGIEIPGLGKRIPHREEVTKTIRKSELVVESVDPNLLRVDPFCKITGRPKYIIEVEEVDFSAIRKLEAEGIYEKVDQIEDIETHEISAGVPQTTKDVPDSGREMATGVIDKETIVSKMAPRKPVVLYHFWGDIEVEKEINGKKLQLYENYNIVLANNKWIIRKKKNPHSHGKYPYILIPCVIAPFKFWPTGLIEPIRSTLDYMDDLHNFTLDGVKFDLMNMFGVDFDSLEDPINDLVIKPGQFIKMKNQGQSINNSIAALRSQSTPINESLSMIRFMDATVQMAMGVNDPLMGMMVKGDTTATEYRGSMTQSTIKFESIARDIEEFSLNPAIEMIFQLICQNMDTGMWVEITGDMGDPIQEYISPERIEGNYDFYATAISGFLSQMEYMQKLVTVFSTIIQAAPILQLAPEEARAVLKAIVKAHGLKEIDDMLSNQPPMMLQMLQQIQMMVQKAMQGDPQALPMIMQMLSQYMGQQGQPKTGEPPTQPPNANMAPENMSQRMTSGMGIGGL